MVEADKLRLLHLMDVFEERGFLWRVTRNESEFRIEVRKAGIYMAGAGPTVTAAAEDVAAACIAAGMQGAGIA